MAVHRGDWHRLLLGNLPWAFLLEAAARTLVLYLVLVTALRLMGRRMASAMTRNELAALVSLAAAVGPAMEGPERGILAPVVIAAIVVGAQRLLGHAGIALRRGMRLFNQRRLREVRRTHGGEVEIFCGHDVLEFERLAGRTHREPVAEPRAHGRHGPLAGPT